jgi:hypothetical protein
MSVDLLSRIRDALGTVGDLDRPASHYTPPPPPPIEDCNDDGDEDARKIFDRVEYLVTMQDSGNMRRLINAKKDISDYLNIDYFFVMSIVRDMCNTKVYKALPKRFDRVSRQ